MEVKVLVYQKVIMMEQELLQEVELKKEHYLLVILHGVREIHGDKHKMKNILHQTWFFKKQPQ